MLRCSSFVARRSPRSLASSTTRRRPSLMGTPCSLSTRQRNNSVSLARPQQPLPQRRMLRLQEQPMFIPTTPNITSAVVPATMPPSPLFSSMMMMQHHQQQHHQHQQHLPYHPSNKEAALTFAALLQTLRRLPSQRLTVMSSSHPLAASASTLNVLEDSMLTDDDDEDAWNEQEGEDSMQKLLQAPAPAPAPVSMSMSMSVSASSSLTPLVLEKEDEHSNDDIFSNDTTTVLLQPHYSAIMDDLYDEADDSHAYIQNNNMTKIIQSQHNNNNSNSNNETLREVQGRILHFIGKRNAARALQLFYATTVDNHQQQEHHHAQQQQQQQQQEEKEEEFLSLHSVKQLFFLVSRKHPIDSYRVLLYYQRAVQAKQANERRQQQQQQQQQQQHGMAGDDDDMTTTADAGVVEILPTTTTTPKSKDDNDDDKNFVVYDVGMYERQCDVLRFLEPNMRSYNDIEILVRRVIADVLHKLDGGPDDAAVSTTTTTRRKRSGGSTGQERCIPILVSALAQQRSVKLGHFCPKLYQHMINHNFDLSSGYLEHLLGLSKYHRQDDLPFPSILKKAVVKMNRLVDPITVLKCIENLFPYTDMTNVTYALESLIHLVKMDNSSSSSTVHAAADEKSTRYKVDISILEAMGAAAAAQGNTRVCLLIWDLLDLLNYHDHPPSVMIYENTAIGFCQAGPAFYPNVFVILQEMQSRHGYIPSRALIRGLSKRFRYSHDNLDAALDAFLATTTITTTTTTTATKGTAQIVLEESSSSKDHSINAIAGFNAILAARAERGDLDHALELLDRIQSSSNIGDDDDDAIAVVANADTYGFLFEALGKHLVIRRRQLQHRGHRRHHRHHHHHQQHQKEDDNNEEEEELLLQKCWHCADSFLTLMENQGIAPTTHILREYIELLCQMNDVATATAIVRETIQSNNCNNSSSNNNNSNNSNAGNDGNGQQPVIGNKTLYRVAVANAHAQNFDVAREVAEMASVYNHEPMPFLLQKINSMERADAAQDDGIKYRDHGGDDF